MSTTRPIPDRFLVAFSFAGEQRDLVRSIAEAVEQRLGHGTVFYDEWFEHYVAGSASDTKLQEIYGKKSELVVVGISGEYGTKPWTITEFDAVRALNMQLRASQNRQDADRILPLRVGYGEVPGNLFNTIAPDVRTRPANATAELIINRLQIVRPDATRQDKEASTVRSVFLAECTPDLEDETKPVSRQRMKAFLEGLGWTVLPAEEYPADEYQSRLEADLQNCLAFVQLLGPYPWKRGGFDRLQNDAAAKIGLPQFRFRSTEIDLDKLDASQREFLSATGIIATGFEDFKQDVEHELAILAERRNTTKDGEPTDECPRVLVVIRAQNPDVLWEKVFQWFYEEQHVLSDLLAPSESLELAFRARPYHGVVIVCEAAGLEEGPLSPRKDLAQCSTIQLGVKKSKLLPPVALVYWPPPDPSWAKLLRTQPLKLVRILGCDNPPNLGEFLDKVREVAQ